MLDLFQSLLNFININFCMFNSSNLYQLFNSLSIFINCLIPWAFLTSFYKNVWWIFIRICISVTVFVLGGFVFMLQITFFLMKAFFYFCRIVLNFYWFFVWCHLDLKCTRYILHVVTIFSLYNDYICQNEKGEKVPSQKTAGDGFDDKLVLKRIIKIQGRI